MKPTFWFAVLPMLFAMPNASAAPQSETTATAGNTYTIQPGDTLERIARKNHCSVTALGEANHLTPSSIIHAGQKLTLPSSSTPPKPSATQEAPKAPKPSPTQETPKPTASGSNKTHKVEQGETYYSISKKYGVSMDTLMAANPKVKANGLYPGLVIHLSVNKPAEETTPPKPKPEPETAAIPKTPATGKKPADSTPPKPAPTAEKPPTPAETPAANTSKGETASTGTEKKIRSITIDGEMTYAEFAAKHGTTITRLNSLNGLDLTSSTILAKGSELYVPVQP